MALDRPARRAGQAFNGFKASQRKNEYQYDIFRRKDVLPDAPDRVADQRRMSRHIVYATAAYTFFDTTLQSQLQNESTWKFRMRLKPHVASTTSDFYWPLVQYCKDLISSLTFLIMDNEQATIDSVLDSLAALVDCEDRHYIVKYDYTSRQPTVSSSPAAAVASTVLTDDSSSSSSHETLMKNSLSSTSLQDVQEIGRIQQSQSRTAATSQQQQQPHSSTANTNSFRFWRHQMIDWATVVVDSFNMDRELVQMSMNLLDRYVSLELRKPQAAPITRDDFQLFSMTCLYLVIKLNEPYPRKIGIESLVNMSRGFYSETDVSLTELDLLKGLDYRVNPPTSASHVKLLLQVFPKELQSTRLQNTALTLTELAMTAGTMIGCRESLVGLASVVYAARMDGVAESRLQKFMASVAAAVPIGSNADFEQIYQSLELAYGF
ncbi:hypothetical protein MPSEU_000066600 [Mayamaea pseudoterrestris]|nr:hypothetical protein MPSEU_000066600 [Mayamaea pseudoterrestris]